MERSVSNTRKYSVRERKSRVFRKNRLRFVRKTPKQALSPRTKWRVLIRRVINNLSWMSPEKRSPHMQFDQKSESTRVVTQYDKYLFFKSPSERKDEDLHNLAQRISAYKSFRKYPMDLRVSLLRRATYVAFNKSVVITHAGMKMDNMYILVKGSGKAIRLNADSEQDDLIVREGYMCGQSCLIYDRPSATSLITDGPTEWIVVHRNHFQSNAKNLMMRLYFEIECAMNKFNFFDKLTYFEMKEYEVLSEIVRAKPLTVLPMFEGTVALSYFVLEGRCSVLQKIILERDPKLDYPGYKLHNNQDLITPGSNAEAFIIRTCYITRRGIFGLGEEACKWVIMTSTACELMVIPRYMLLKFNKNMVWDRLRDQLDSAYPSLSLILRQFNQGRRWSRYKHRLALQAALPNRLNVSGNDVHKVPLIARCSEMQSDDEDEHLRVIKSKNEPKSSVSCDLNALANTPAYAKLFNLLPKQEVL